MTGQRGQVLIAVLVVTTVVLLLAGAVAFEASALLAQQRHGAGGAVQADFTVRSAVAAAVAQVQADPQRCPAARRSPATSGTSTPVSPPPAPDRGEGGGERAVQATPRATSETPRSDAEGPTARPLGPRPSRLERPRAPTPGPPTPTSPAPSILPTAPTASPARPAPTLPIIVPGQPPTGASCLRLDGLLQGLKRARLTPQPGPACAVAALPALGGRAWVFFDAWEEGPGAAWVDARPTPACAPPTNGGCEQRLSAGSSTMVQVALDCDLSHLATPLLHLAGASARSVLFAAAGDAGASLYLLAVGTGSGGEEVVLTGGPGGLVLRDEEVVP
ncbi:MAG TPA: hypothetical protein VKY90_20970 [Candidatus Dormibacteraeota bacterium]|nr:hypothetical protein [Candidatus Dormibacteraeota bacterium]